MKDGAGPLVSNGIELVGFIKTKVSRVSNYPDVEIIVRREHFRPGKKHSRVDRIIVLIQDVFIIQLACVRLFLFCKTTTLGAPKRLYKSLHWNNNVLSIPTVILKYNDRKLEDSEVSLIWYLQHGDFYTNKIDNE